MSKDLLYEIAYEEAVRALSQQAAEIDSLRTRAGLLFSAAAITTSFLGAQALRGGTATLASWLALFTFAVVATSCLAIFWPRWWEGAVNPREVIETYIESVAAESTGDLRRDLSLHMHNSYLDNHEGLEQLALFLRLASSALSLEVVLWIIALALGD
jgi:polyferredoxin